MASWGAGVLTRDAPRRAALFSRQNPGGSKLPQSNSGGKPPHSSGLSGAPAASPARRRVQTICYDSGP